MVNELPSFVPDLSGAKFVQAGPITHANVSLHILIIAYLTPLHYLTLLRMEPAPRAISNPTICINLSDFLSSLCFKLSIPKTAPCQLTWTKASQTTIRLAALISGPQEGTIIVQHSLISLMIPLRHSGISVLKFCFEGTCEPIQVVSYSNILQHRI